MSKTTRSNGRHSKGFFKAWGTVGGRSKSPAKVAAARRNALKAARARRKKAAEARRLQGKRSA